MMKAGLLRKMAAALTVSFMVASGVNMQAQEYFNDRDSYFKNPLKFGVGADQFVTGNWHGACYSPYLTFMKGKNSLSVGPVIQKRSLETNGGRIVYSRVLTGDNPFAVDAEGELVDGFFQMNFFAGAQYLRDTRLSYSSVVIEERTNKGLDVSWRDLRLSTVELSAGVEVHLKITRNISWKNYFGACVYNHLTYVKGMYHEKIAPVLMLGTGLVLKQK